MSAANETFNVILKGSAQALAGTLTLPTGTVPSGTFEATLIPATGTGYSGTVSLSAVVPSANDTTVLLGSSSGLTDASGNLWTITAGGQVAVNGVTDTRTGNVTELAIVSNVIWQKNKSNLWWSKTSPSASWLPANGTATSPLPPPVLPVASAPVASPAAGNYTGAQAVALSSLTPAATIHYTTDGSTPTASSPLYTGPVAVSASETIKALAIAPGFTNSPVTSFPYIITVTPPPVVTPPAAGAFVVNESKIIAAANKIGMNLGNTDYYNALQPLKNRLAGGQHPGFEPVFRRQIQQVAASTTTSISNGNVWDYAPLDYWAGATLTVLTGPQAGTVVTVIGNNAADTKSVAVSYTFSPALPSALAAGTVFKVENSPAPSPSIFWTQTNSWNRANGGTFSTNSTDLPPNTTGIQAVTIDATAAGSSPQLNFYWDGANGQINYVMAGTYTATFWAKAQSGKPVIEVSCGRFNGFSASQSFSPTSEWAEYTFHFAPNEVFTTAAGDGCYFRLTVTGGAVSVDDMWVAADADTNPTVFTNQFMALIAQGNFDAQRYWVGQEAESLDNWLKPQLGSASAVAGTGDPDYTSQGSNWIGLHDWLAMCQAAGNTRTTFVMPITFTPTEAANLVEYLAGAVTTPYGAKRAALGQSAPWTSVFTEINIEYGNEIWNGATPGVSISYGNAGSPGSIWGYYDLLIPTLGVMRADPSWSSVLKISITSQMSAYWIEQLTSAQLALIDKVDLAPYTQGAPTVLTPASALFTPVFAECFGEGNNFSSNSGFLPAVEATVKAGKLPLVYEFQNSTTAGSGTTAALTGFAEGAAYGVANILEALEGMKQGSPEWNFFCLPQYAFGFGDTTVKIWGAIANAAAGLVRPNFLALQAANSAILPSLLSSTLPTGTYNFAASNGVAATSNVPYLTGYAFLSGAARGVIFINASLTESATVPGISGMTAPGGAIQQVTLASPNPTDNNETSNVVALKESTLPSLASPITVPPFGMVALNWTV
jgi:hypothetical protein